MRICCGRTRTTIWRRCRGTAARAGLAYVDVSTGEFRATEVDAAEAAAVARKHGRARIAGGAEAPLFRKTRAARWIVTELEDWVFSADYADRILREHFKLLSLDGCGLAGKQRAMRPAGRCCITCATRSGRRSIIWIRRVIFDRADTMVLDAVTVRNLELVEPIFSDGGATLIGVLDQTSTGMGGRLLRQRLLRPSLDRRRSRRGWMR